MFIVRLRLHDRGEAGGFLYYVMPYIEGELLRDKLAHEGELPNPEVGVIADDDMSSTTGSLSVGTPQAIGFVQTSVSGWPTHPETVLVE